MQLNQLLCLKNNLSNINIAIRCIDVNDVKLANVVEVVGIYSAVQ